MSTSIYIPTTLNYLFWTQISPLNPRPSYPTAFSASSLRCLVIISSLSLPKLGSLYSSPSLLLLQPSLSQLMQLHPSRPNTLEPSSVMLLFLFVLTSNLLLIVNPTGFNIDIYPLLLLSPWFKPSHLNYYHLDDHKSLLSHLSVSTLARHA